MELLIDDTIINQLGFHTTTHNRFIYQQVRNSEMQLMLYQVDNFYLGAQTKLIISKEFIQCYLESNLISNVNKINIIPFEFLEIFVIN